MDGIATRTLEMNRASAAHMQQLRAKVHISAHNTIHRKANSNSHASCVKEQESHDALCEALSQYPLALGCGAALGVLRGSSPTALEQYDTTLHDLASKTRITGQATTDAVALPTRTVEQQQTCNALPVPLATSPFHFAASSTFHRQLQSLANNNTTHKPGNAFVWARPEDMLCHGWQLPQCVTQSRKKPRRQDVAQRQALHNSDASRLQATSTTENDQQVSVNHVDAGPLTPLHARVVENSTLLEELLLLSPQRDHNNGNNRDLPDHNLQPSTSCTVTSPLVGNSTPQHTPCVAMHSTTSSKDITVQAAAFSSMPTHSATTIAASRRMRVSPPDVFADAVRARKKRRRTNENGDEAMNRVTEHCEGETSGRTSACLTLPWRLLVDTRERVGCGTSQRGHAALLEMLAKQKVPCQSVMLPAGDFMLNVDLIVDESSSGVKEGQSNDETQVQQRDTPIDHLSSCPHDANNISRKGTFTHTASLSGKCDDHSPNSVLQAPLPDGQGNHSVSLCSNCESSNAFAGLYSHIGPIVIERKTLADLEASVKGNRYHEQRQLLQASPFLHIIWLIEGDINTLLSHRRRTRQGTSTSNSTADDILEETRRRVHSACASLALSERFLVVHTRSLQESVLFLKALCELYVLRLQNTLAQGQTSLDAVNMNAECNTTARMPAWTTPFVPLCPFNDTLPVYVAPTERCLREVRALQKRLRATTALPRMLMSIRGCSSHLAQLLAGKYGTLHRLWKLLVTGGREVCDGDMDIQRLTLPQKKVFVLLTEFLLAQQYS